MKVALIGKGRWGQVLLKELRELSEVKYECDSKTDLNQVFSDAEVEAVFIATPIPTHCEIAHRALEAGKHVFLEKPGTTSSADLEKLVELAEAKNLRFALGYEFIHHPAIIKIKQLIEGKEVRFIRLEWQKWGSFKYAIEENLLCHDISILKFLGLDVSNPKAHKTGFVSESDIIATSFGANTMSVINRVSLIKSRTMLVKLEDTAYLWSNEELFEVVGEELKKIEISTVTPVAAEIVDFFSAIKDNRKAVSNGQFALEVYKVIERV